MLDFIFDLIGDFLAHVLGQLRWWILVLILLVIGCIVIYCCV